LWSWAADVEKIWDLHVGTAVVMALIATCMNVSKSNLYVRDVGILDINS
jgi:hypothetical protein